MTMQKETATKLLTFVDSELSARDLEAWIIEVSEDPAYSEFEREALEELRIKLIEVGEGIRPLSTVREDASLLLRNLQPGISSSNPARRRS